MINETFGTSSSYSLGIFYSENSSQKQKSHLIWGILFGLMGRQVMSWAASLIVACKYSSYENTLSLQCAAAPVVPNKLLRICLQTELCCKSVTSKLLDQFKYICIFFEMMKISQTQIWLNLGLILRTSCGIKNLNVVSIISTLCVIESSASPTHHSQMVLSYNCAYP